MKLIKIVLLVVLIALAVYTVGTVFNALDTLKAVDKILLVAFVVVLIIWLAFIRPETAKRKFEDAKNLSIIKGVIYGLYLSGISFHTLASDVYDHYAKPLYAEYSAKPTETLGYDTASGIHYSASPSHSILFAVICCCLYAKDNELDDLLSRCESALPDARLATIHRP